MTPRIGIIGNGNAGSALSRALGNAGYDVRAVGHDPDGVRDTAAQADVVILAVPFAAVDAAVQEMGHAVDGKVLVDVTNVVTEEKDFAIESTRTSGAEELARKAPGARVVKAFNTMFASQMDKGELNGERLTLFVAGDDTDAKSTVLDMGRDLGFDAVDSGGLRNARWMEALGYFNMQLTETAGGEHAFRLVH